MRNRAIELAVVGALALSRAAAQTPAGPPADFRKAAWGMSQAQVTASESLRPRDVRQSNGETIVEYAPVRFGGLETRLIYIFAKGKLARAKYIFEDEHSDLNLFIADYRAIDPVLLESHGKPASARAIWEDDTYQDEPKSYLDQDRATPESILPSDRQVGLSVSAGHLRLYTQWETARTRIVHALSGHDFQIMHQLEYSSRELEPLEKEVRAARP